MPKVLRIINRLNLGGPTYNAAYLSKYLAPEFETLLVAGIKEDDEESSEFIVTDMGLQPVYIPEMRREINFTNDRIAYQKIKKLIAEFKPDIVHTHAAKAGTLGRLAAANSGVPVILHTFHGHVFHSYFNPLKTAVFKSVERYLSKKSTAIIAISDIQKEELCAKHKVCKPAQTVVIPLGFDLTRFQTDQLAKRAAFRTEYKINDDTVAIAIVGRIVPVKNHELFIRGFAAVKAAYKGKVKGFIIGDGDDRSKMEQIAESLGLTSEDLVFTSWIFDVDRPLAGCDIVAMTSLNEGTPVSLIEAQAAGKPIVTTEVGGIGNVVIPGKTALLSPSQDLEGFTQNLLKLVEDKALRANMSALGWEHVRQRFHYERLVGDMRKLYTKLLSEKKVV
ncbi:MAG: D-inositol 3-phosphate glycosyltransferase [Bacteroidetes bacterium ADurb.Bin397]|nr:MAG: D-inositol 3-phosphate glycosyltransferase [Bacteroidetes bacterium ADurb.Bin397]